MPLIDGKSVNSKLAQPFMHAGVKWQLESWGMEWCHDSGGRVTMTVFSYDVPGLVKPDEAVVGRCVGCGEEIGEDAVGWHREGMCVR